MHEATKKETTAAIPATCKPTHRLTMKSLVPGFISIRYSWLERGTHLFTRYGAFNEPLRKGAHSHTRPLLGSGYLRAYQPREMIHMPGLETFHPFTHKTLLLWRVQITTLAPLLLSTQDQCCVRNSSITMQPMIGSMSIHRGVL